VTARGPYFALPEEQCAICAQNASFDITHLSTAAATVQHTAAPVNPMLNRASPPAAMSTVTSSSATTEPPAFALNTPYTASCGHTYCYICISTALLRGADDDTPFSCLRCAAHIHWADRTQVPLGSDEEERDSVDEYEWTSDTAISEELGDSVGSLEWTESEPSDRQ
jgi:peroxin-2